MSKPIIHLFYRGDEAKFPADNGWEKFGPGLDTVRLFAVAAQSWRKNGWEVKRLDTTGLIFDQRFQPSESGQCSASLDWYPLEYWQFIPAALAVASGDPTALHHFACIDVINQGFGPVPRFTSDEPRCFNYQKEHFSLSLFSANAAWLNEALRILMNYDRGALPVIERPYVSDETILREYATNYADNASLLFGHDAGRDYAQLLHFSRSTMARLFNEIPAVP